MTDQDNIPTPAGWRHTNYAVMERERRWLCAGVPKVARAAAQIDDLTDIYFPDSQMRLRLCEPLTHGQRYFKLTKKIQLDDPRHHLLTTIYLSDTEYDTFRLIGGLVVKKRRHRFRLMGHAMAVDMFQGPLEDLVLAEVSFESDGDMALYPTPEFAVREVTHDPQFGGMALSRRAASGDGDVDGLTRLWA